MTSRRLPRWMGPDGLRPDATTMGFPGTRRSAAAMTWSAIRETQSSSVSRAIRAHPFWARMPPSSQAQDPTLTHATDHSEVSFR